MECRWNYSKFLRANKTNPNIFAYAKNRKPAVACRRFTEIRPADWQGSGLCLESRPRQRSANLWWSQVARSCNVGTRTHNSSWATKKRNLHLTALGARPRKDSGGFWDEGRESPTAGHSRTYQAFCFETKSHKNRILNRKYYKFRANYHQTRVNYHKK